MESVIDPFIRRLNDIEQDLPNVAKKILEDNSSEIVLLVKGQLTHGLNSYGKPLKWSGGNGFYAESTQSYANRDGIYTPKEFKAPYNFYWSGETLDNLEMGKINKTTFEITTVAFKKKHLESIYGEIFDLTEEHNDYVNNNILLPKLQEYLLEEMVRGLI